MENIYQKIHKIMQQVKYLQKDDDVSTGKNSSYKAITEEKVTTEVRKAMIENGVVIIPIEVTHSRTDEVLKDQYGNEKVSRLTTADCKYRIQNIEDKDDYIIASSSGTGVDTQDKGIGKALTYAYKYLLLRTFAIPTGEDPDKISSELYGTQFATKKLITTTQEQILRAKIKTEQVKNIKVIDILSDYGYKTLAEIEQDKYEEISSKIFDK